MQWNPTEIQELDTPLTTSTGPTRVITDAGPAFAKFVGNPEGSQTLFCELVGIRAAAWLGLSTFEYALLPISEDGLVTYKDGSESKAGPAFLTRFEEGAPWGGSEEELQSIQNLKAISGLVVLDTWLLNCDRFRKQPPRDNVRNVFLASRDATKGKFQLLAMDHTHCFTCGRVLTPKLSQLAFVRENQIHGNFPSFRSYMSSQAAQDYLTRLGGLDRKSAESFVEGIPREWEVSSETSAAVVELMLDRARYLAENCGKLLVEQGCLTAELNFEGTD